MKQLLSLIIAAVVLASVGHVIAASSVDLSVKGSITPAACTPTLSGGGVVDHGKIAFKDLNRTGETQLPVATLRLSVSCTTSTLFAVKSTDNRSGSSSEQNGTTSGFGVGFVNGSVKVGFYLLKMNNSMADGVTHAVIESANGQTWFDAFDNSQMWQPLWMRSFKSSSGGGVAPMPVKDMQTDLIVETRIARSLDLPADQEIPIDGSATLDVVYL